MTMKMTDEERSAINLVHSHFAAINAGSIAVISSQMFQLPTEGDRRSLKAYAIGMIGIAPLTLERAEPRGGIAMRATAHGAFSTTFVHVEFVASNGAHTGDLPVWHSGDGTPLIAARFHDWYFAR